MNKVVLCGRLTDDVKAESKGKGEDAVFWANFTIAVKDGNDPDGNPRTQFIRCVLFGKPAKVMEEFTAKGQPICVSGRLKVNVYDDDNNVRHWNTVVQVDDFDLIGSAPKKEEEPKKNTKKYHK